MHEAGRANARFQSEVVHLRARVELLEGELQGKDHYIAQLKLQVLQEGPKQMRSPPPMLEPGMQPGFHAIETLQREVMMAEQWHRLASCQAELLSVIHPDAAQSKNVHEFLHIANTLSEVLKRLAAGNTNPDLEWEEANHMGHRLIELCKNQMQCWNEHLHPGILGALGRQGADGVWREVLSLVDGWSVNVARELRNMKELQRSESTGCEEMERHEELAAGLHGGTHGEGRVQWLRLMARAVEGWNKKLSKSSQELENSLGWLCRNGVDFSAMSHSAEDEADMMRLMGERLMDSCERARHDAETGLDLVECMERDMALMRGFIKQGGVHSPLKAREASRRTKMIRSTDILLQESKLLQSSLEGIVTGQMPPGWLEATEARERRPLSLQPLRPHDLRSELQAHSPEPWEKQRSSIKRQNIGVDDGESMATGSRNDCSESSDINKISNSTIDNRQWRQGGSRGPNQEATGGGEVLNSMRSELLYSRALHQGSQGSGIPESSLRSSLLGSTSNPVYRPLNNEMQREHTERGGGGLIQLGVGGGVAVHDIVHNHDKKIGTINNTFTSTFLNESVAPTVSVSRPTMNMTVNTNNVNPSKIQMPTAEIKAASNSCSGSYTGRKSTPARKFARPVN